MKGPVNIRFGVYRVEILSRAFIGSLIFRRKGIDLCLISTKYKRNSVYKVQLIDCVESVSISDGRDLWQLQENQEVTSLGNNDCLGLFNGVYSPDSYVETGDCLAGAQAGDKRHHWSLSVSQGLVFQKDNRLCLMPSSSSKSELLSQEGQFIASASSSIPDDLHIPLRVLQHTHYWASMPNIPQAQYILDAIQPIIINTITLTFQYCPFSYQVQAIDLNSIPVTLFTKHNNEQFLQVISFAAIEIIGIHINFYESHPQLGMLNNQVIYGIKTIEINEVTQDVVLAECHSSPEYQWLLDDSSFRHFTSQSQFQEQQQLILKLENQMKQVSQQLMVIPNSITKSVQAVIGVGNQLTSLLKTRTDQQQQLDILVQDQKTLRSSQKVQSQLGSTIQKAGEYCGQIIKKYPLKRSGMYWVISECMTVPLRVYCDFSQPTTPFYYYSGPLLLTQSLQQSFTSSEQALLFTRQQCLQYQLAPVQITTDSQLTNVIQVLTNLNIQFDDQMIPLALDYSCVYQNNCLGALSSLNDMNSKDVQSIFNCRKPTQLHRQQTDSIAYGLALHLLARVHLGSVLIKGVICSDNDSTPPPLYILNCQSSIHSDDHFNSPFFTNFKLKCPAFCSDNPAKVYGDFIFKEDSSICRAALFQGLIQDNKGGPIVLQIEQPIKSYPSKTQNLIETTPYSGKSNRAFTLQVLPSNCPNQKKTPEPTSFIQMNSEVKVEDQDFIKFLQKITSNALTNSTNNKTQIKKDDCDKSIEIASYENDPVLNTKEGLKQMQDLFVIKVEQISKYQKVIQQSMFFQLEMTKLIDVFNQKDQNKNPFLQREGIDKMRGGVEGIQDLIKEHNDELVQMKEELELEIKEKEEEMKILNQYIDLTEDYKRDNIEELYEIVKVPRGEGKGQFSFSSRSQFGHSQSIEYRGNHIIKDDHSHLAYYLLGKHQTELYDSQIECKVLLASEGLFSILIRYKDPANYYGVQVQQMNGQGVKRIIKMINNNLTILSEKTDGGYLQNTWYDMIISMSKSTISLQWNQERQVDSISYTSLEKVFAVDDSELVKGQTGWAVNGITQVLVDKWKVTPKECEKAIADNDPDQISPQYFLPGECSRTQEDYFGQIHQKYLTVDALDSNNGPSSWSFQKDRYKRGEVIMQSSPIDSSEIGTLLIRQGHKQCHKGVISVEMYLLDPLGMAGLIFSYQDVSNYMTLEVVPSKTTVQIRHQLKGVYKVVAQNTLVSLPIKTWLRIELQLSGNEVSIQMTLPDQQSSTIIDNHALLVLPGPFGLFTQSSSVAFDNLSSQPPISSTTSNPNKPHLPPSPASNKLPPNQCQQQTTKEQRTLYCQTQFPSDDLSLNTCNNAFCPICCSRSVPSTKLSLQSQCIKICTNNLIVTPNHIAQVQYHHCLVPSNPVHSVYAYCDEHFSHPPQIMHCKIDFCQLCCVMDEKIHANQVADSVVMHCKQDCYAAFFKVLDIIE